jgi:hypothetical protein
VVLVEENECGKRKNMENGRKERREKKIVKIESLGGCVDASEWKGSEKARER